MVPIGTLYRGGENHIKFQAGGNETAQLKIPHCGVVTASEKYTIAHSKHTGICFFALKWDKLPNETDSESEDLTYRGKRRRSPLPTGVPPGAKTTLFLTFPKATKVMDIPFLRPATG